MFCLLHLLQDKQSLWLVEEADTLEKLKKHPYFTSLSPGDKWFFVKKTCPSPEAECCVCYEKMDEDNFTACEHNHFVCHTCTNRLVHLTHGRSHADQVLKPSFTYQCPLCRQFCCVHLVAANNKMGKKWELFKLNPKQSPRLFDLKVLQFFTVLNE